jgi:hypothetical protein
MAKQIKLIQCPKYGSTDKTEIKPDHFKCNSCSTEYYLDNDDVNYKENWDYYTPGTVAPKPPLKTKKIILLVVAVIVIMMGVMIIPNLLSTNHAVVEANTFSEGSKAQWWGSQGSFFATGDDKPVMVMVGDSYDNNNNAAPAVVFYDMLSKNKIKESKLFFPSKVDTNYAIQHFSNGDIYIIGNK